MDHNKLWKSLQEMGIADDLTCLLRNLYADQEATVRTGHETKDWFKTGKQCIRVVYCHPAYLTCMQRTSCEMPGWMNHKLESRFPGEISNNFRYADDTSLMMVSKEKLKNLWTRVKEEEKSWLNTQCSKN